MKKTLFISKELGEIAGSGVGARMHRDVLKKIVGEENLYIIDLDVKRKPEKSEHYWAFGKYPSKWNRIVRNLQGHTFYFSNQMINDICWYIIQNKIEFVFVDDSIFGLLVKAIKTQCANVFVVSFFHDVKAELFPIWMKNKGIFTKIDLSLGIKNEKISVKYADKNIVLNKNEELLLIKHYGITADGYLPVCVNKLKSNGSDPFKENGKKHILFVGTAYLPNINAIRWFHSEVLDSIRSSYDLYVVGKGLECLKSEFANDPEMNIIGFAEDLFSFYQYADIVIAPLTDGGGMKIKTAEAFSCGKTFMGSEESLRGYYENLDTNLVENVVFQCDTAQQYIEALNKLIDKKIEKCNTALVSVYEEYYSTNAAYQAIKKIMDIT